MREGFPKLSVAMDGDSQASQGRAARSVFWKALPHQPNRQSEQAKSSKVVYTEYVRL